MFRSEDNGVNFSFPKTLSELLFELTRSLCCHQNATSIVLTFTLFIIIRKMSLDFVVLLDFIKIRCEHNGVSFLFPKTLVRVNRVDLDKMLFIINRTLEFGVLLDFIMLRCQHNGVRSFFRVNGNRVDLHEMLFINIRTIEIGV